jgi:uncharacterized protein (DUF433 family)/DNA-binding transcriptional MerR regulator
MAGGVERSVEDRVLMRRALRSARCRYSVRRASQLSGVPERTLYHWAQTESLVPDWAGASPRGWSYRDVVYARLLAWLRSKGTPLAEATTRVSSIRNLMATSDIDPHLHSDGRVLLVGDEDVDRYSGQRVFGALTSFLDEFDIEEPISEISRGHLWGPDLLRPTEHTYLSPWVVGGEPCVEETRIPTLSIYALHHERALGAEQIADLYPGLSLATVRDAIDLETKLHHRAAVDAPAA